VRVGVRGRAVGLRMQAQEEAVKEGKKATAPVTAKEMQLEIARRRTFAIISHPDAGKTTMTEKLLLYGGALQEAGAVKAKGERRRATSDFMKIEQDRGISISSTALQFEYDGKQINLLDTPGHQDFSEDTYRTIAAADNAVMLLDGAKGLEAQTLKLFDVVKLRKLPVFTFINKMDRPSLEPLELLDTIEQTLGVQPVPMTWPIGSGDRFQGIYDMSTNKVILFTKEKSGGKKASSNILELDDPALESLIPQDILNALREELEILAEIVEPLDLDAVRQQVQTPVFFGSGYNNFGVQQFLDKFLEIAQAPIGRINSGGDGDVVAPETQVLANVCACTCAPGAAMRVCVCVCARARAVHICLCVPASVCAAAEVEATQARARSTFGDVGMGAGFFGLCLQVAGKHGPKASRPHRFCACMLRPLRKGYAGVLVCVRALAVQVRIYKRMCACTSLCVCALACVHVYVCARACVRLAWRECTHACMHRT